MLVEHWDVIQVEATEGHRKAALPCSDKTFPKYK